MKEVLKEVLNFGIERKGIKVVICLVSVIVIGFFLFFVIILLLLVVVIGVFMIWMRFCDVGVVRIEFGVIFFIFNLFGVEVGSVVFGVEVFLYVLWGMVLNNLGWLFVVFILGYRMCGIVEKMNMKYNFIWVKKLFVGVIVGLFVYFFLN